jgi:hypothetical protein
MISTRFMELGKRRGLMIITVVLTVGIPTLFLALRLVLHAVVPHSYGPAGSYGTFNSITVGVLAREHPLGQIDGPGCTPEGGGGDKGEELRLCRSDDLRLSGSERASWPVPSRI